MSRPITLLTFAAALAFTTVQPDVAGAALSAKGATVSFDAHAPAVTVHGESSSLVVSEVKDEVKLKVDLTTFTNNIAKRQEHMLRALKAVDADGKVIDPHNTAELRVAKSALQFPSGGDTSGDVKGKFTLNGQTKDVTIHYTAKAGSPIAVDGSFEVNYMDFGIEEQCFMRICVKPTVQVNARFGVKKDD